MEDNRVKKIRGGLWAKFLRKIMPNSGRLNIFIWMFSAKVFLDISYEILSRNWGYYGFKYNPSVGLFFLGWLGFACLAVNVCQVVNKIHNNSKTIYLILIFFVALPSTVLVGYGVISVNTFIYTFVYLWMVYLCSYHLNFVETKRVKFKFATWQNRISPHLIIILITVISGLVIVFISYKYAGLRLSVSLDSVYDWRTDNKSSMSVTARYLMGAAVACNTTALAYWATKKNSVLFVITIILQIMAFSIDGLKSTLFVLVFALIVLLFSTIKVERYIPMAFAGLSCIALVERLILKSEKILDVLIRRVLFLPGIITNYYVDFFSKNPPDYFLQGPLRFLGIESSYSRGISYLIGAEYFVDGINFNSGLVSEGVANLGVAGVFLLPILLSVCFKLFDALTRNVERNIVLVSAIYIGWFFMSSSITTALATHGIWAQYILLYFISKEQENR